MQFAGGMSFKGEQRVIAQHAAAIVGYADQSAAAIFNFYANAHRPRIERILEQLFYYGGGSFYYFAGRYFVRDIVREYTDTAHMTTLRGMPCKLSTRPGRYTFSMSVGLIRVSEVLSALSFALDLTEGQPMGHSVRTCVLGMRIAREIGLPVASQSDLYYALLMKDAGCSSNASRMFQILGTDDIQAKRDVKTTDWTRAGWESLQYALSHVRTGAPFLERVRAIAELGLNRRTNAREMVQIRCERGANIARRIGLSENTAQAIQSLDELWNGSGQPQGLRGQTIPLLSRIMNLAQCAEVFYTKHGSRTALQMAASRSGRWFDPQLVKALQSLARRPGFWAEIAAGPQIVTQLEPVQQALPATETTLDNICLAFADVVDAKSPFTYNHSVGVAAAAVEIGRNLAMNEMDLALLRRAALLHDIGKLSVSNAILDKPAKLNAGEWEIVKKHPYYSFQILKRVPGFAELSEIAGSHHEKLDGSGYFRNMTAERLSLPARILAVADVYDALAAKRPYRDALAQEHVFAIMQRDAPHALDGDCFEALRYSADRSESFSGDLGALSSSVNPISPGHTADKNTPSTLLKPLAHEVH